MKLFGYNISGVALKLHNCIGLLSWGAYILSALAPVRAEQRTEHIHTVSEDPASALAGQSTCALRALLSKLLLHQQCRAMHQCIVVHHAST
jgi:hypothetical protein